MIACVVPLLGHLKCLDRVTLFDEGDTANSIDFKGRKLCLTGFMTFHF